MITYDKLEQENPQYGGTDEVANLTWLESMVKRP